MELKKMITTSRKGLAALAMAPFIAWSVASGATLTGAVAYSTDLVDYWNTLGGDFPAANLYLQNSAGGWINSGDGPSTSIDIPLLPGTHTYAIFGQPGEDRAVNALNLFFDGDNVDPRISVAANIATASDAHPPISPVGGTSYTLAIGPVPGANTLTYIDGSETITLTDFIWQDSRVQNRDVVQYFDNTPGEGPDNIGSFTLTVSSAPEPQSYWLIMLGVLTAGAAKYKKLLRRTIRRF